MRALTFLVVLLCSACVVQPPPPRYAPVAVAQPASPQPAQQTCREFDTSIMIDGQEQQAHGTACLQPDGSWKVE
jgi:hypothetical protein